ncbi:MAG: ferrous iron transport protein A [Chloroflexi bacterium]|nr:ferrous iron transport protein A [Chloroflexota bacterium]
MLSLRFTHANQSTRQHAGKKTTAVGKALTLAQADTGKQVTIRGFGELSPAYKQHLQAYGVLPGRKVQVLAQRPVTIVLVEQTELAFESVIANNVLIE